MARYLLIATLCVLGLSGIYSRSVLQEDLPAPDFAPAPTGIFNGVEGYSCPTPGSTGYLFQPAPCAFGEYSGEPIYCDEPTEGGGIVGIREEGDDDADDGQDCIMTSDCDMGFFCNIHFNGTCTPVAPVSCFAGAPAPAPAPVAGEDDDD